MKLSDQLALIESALKILAIIVGSAWAYMKFLRGRTFEERIEAKIRGRLVATDSGLLLAATVTVTNVGLGEVSLNHDGCGIRVFAAPLAGTSEQLAYPLAWNRIGSFDILTGHDFVEPGEALNDEIVVALPKETECVQLELSVVSKKSKMWRAVGHAMLSVRAEGADHD